jgi:hypothetical protein
LIELTYEAGFIILAVFAFAYYHAWGKAHTIGYDEGYFDACADVAQGNITVSLQEKSNVSDDT